MKQNSSKVNFFYNSYTSKIPIKNLHIMMNHFKDFQFVVFIIDTHAEIKTSISAEDIHYSIVDYISSQAEECVTKE